MNMGGKGLSLYWYDCRIEILDYMHTGIKGKVGKSDRNLLGIYGILFGFL